MKRMVRADMLKNILPHKEEIAMLKTSRYVFLLLLIVLFLSTVLACSHSSPTGPGDNTASVTVSVDFQTPSQAQSKAVQKFLGTFTDITSLTVDVLKGGTSIITGQHLTYSNGVWSGTLANLPIGPSLAFIGHAYNASAVQIFTGTTIQAMTGHSDSVSILMAPVSDGVPAMFPRITKILVPAQILSSNTGTIGIWVEASSGETLTYAATAAAGGGSFSPSSGTITLAGTMGTLVLSYTAPSTAGTYTHSIRVTNSQTNWVETDFSTVVAGTSSASLSAQFSPVITAIGAKRSGSNVTFTAVVSDTGPLNALTYLWGFDGGLTFANNTTNPAVLQGYDETKSGNLTLTVTNGAGGATTVSYYIALGLLPDDVVISGTQMGGAIQGNSLNLTAAVSTLAGSPTVTGFDDGTGTAARFNYPFGITTDGTNLYVTDSNNHTIRKIVISTGAVTTLAGAAGYQGSTDGTGATALFNSPQGITTDGTNLYVADSGNSTIRKIVISTGAVTTLAGTAGSIGPDDGIGATALFYIPDGITTDGTNLYVADSQNYTIRQIVISTGAVTTLAGTALSVGSTDGIGAAARFNSPKDITTDGTNLYVADAGNTVRKIVISTGAVTTLAGTANTHGTTDGTGAAARFYAPWGITTNGTDLYVADSVNNTVRKIQ